LQVPGGKLFEAEEKIEVRAELAREGESGANMVLRVRLRNAGTSALKIPAGGLPWSRGATAVALVGSNGRALEEGGAEGDSSPGEPAVLDAGASLEGQIPVGKNYPKLGAALKTGDVVLFWSYQLTATEKGGPPRVGGWLVIPREK
jgi:hypothetical protein